ncbi:glycosyl transferase family 2 [Rhodococcus sp. OK519]|nr:glycosyl transferase family 2 [Rhodococcus sp. OK519]
MVSVVIPAHNARNLIDVQLTALAEQDYSGTFEVVVSDNGSTDGLEEHLADHPLHTVLDLRCIDSSLIKGAPHARNAGAAAAKGDFLAFCDADDRVHPGWLSALVRASAEYDAVGGPVETTTLNSPDVASWRPVTPPDKREETPGFLDFALSGNLGLWRTAFDTTGGFDESLTVGEDVDFTWRLQLAGLTLGHEPKAMVAYRLRDNYRALWRQSFAYGMAGPELYRHYRSYGLRPTKPLPLLLFALALVARCPVVPTFISRLSTGGWIYYAAFAAGRVRGSFKYRVYFV